MKLKEYIESLNQMVKDDPSILEYDVVYSSDDEGNSYEFVAFTPSVGHFSGIPWNGFDPTENPNAICIN